MEQTILKRIVDGIIAETRTHLSDEKISPYCIIVLDENGHQVELLSVGQHPGDLHTNITALTNAITAPDCPGVAFLHSINPKANSGGAAITIYVHPSLLTPIGSIMIIGNLNDLNASLISQQVADQKHLYYQ